MNIIPNLSIKATGLKEMQAYFKKIKAEIPQGSRQVVRDISSHIAERAVLNAPILTGLLRSKIKRVAVQTTQDKREFVGGVQDDVPYASWIHEAHYNLGPISRKQPPTLEGGTGANPEGVGRKYIQRVAYFHTGKYLGAISRTILNILASRGIIRQRL